MNQPLKDVIEIYERNGINFNQLLYWHLCFGVVISDYDSFAMCFFSQSENPEKACEIHHSDTLFVTIHSGDMQKALERFKNNFEYIAFQRDFKGSPRVRVYNIQRFKSKLK